MPIEMKTCVGPIEPCVICMESISATGMGPFEGYPSHGENCYSELCMQPLIWSNAYIHAIHREPSVIYRWINWFVTGDRHLHLREIIDLKLFNRQNNVWKLHAKHGLTATASRFNQWQREFAVMPKNSTRFYGAGNRDAKNFKTV